MTARWPPAWAGQAPGQRCLAMSWRHQTGVGGAWCCQVMTAVCDACRLCSPYKSKVSLKSGPSSQTHVSALKNLASCQALQGKL